MSGDNGNRLEKLYREASGEPPPELMAGFSGAVYERTTRKAASRGVGAERRLIFGAVAAAAAGVAGVVVLGREKEGGEETLALAEVDIDLLAELELCREVDFLEMLEALEEIENG